MDQAKLPVINTVLESFRILWRHRRTYVRLAWIPFVVACLLLGGEPLLSTLLTESGLPNALKPPSDAFRALLALVFIVTAIPLITAWHRLIILGEGRENSRIWYSIRVTEWRYLLRAIIFIALVLIAAAILVVITAFIVTFVMRVIGFSHSISSAVLATRLAYFFEACALVPFASYLLLLPAAAIGQPLSSDEADECCEGNLVRLSAAYVLALVPEAIVYWLLKWAEQTTGKFLIGGLMNGYGILDAVITFVLFTVSVGVMSLAYRFLVEGKQLVAAESVAPLTSGA